MDCTIETVLMETTLMETAKTIETHFLKLAELFNSLLL
jgi:hypothetical protein